jgi:hypothetical protein
MWTSAVDCCRPAAAIGCLYVYDLPLRLASTTCLCGLPLRPASTACLYGLLYGLPLPPASTPTACLHHIIVIIVIVIVIDHFLFKRNIYFSLLYVIYVFFLEIIFLSFLLLIVQFKDVIFYCC